jgi:hypothetical protein
MKHSIRGYAMLFCFIVLAGLVVGGRKVDVVVRTPRQCICKFDDVLVPEKQAEIQSFIDVVDKKFTLKQPELVACIRQEFPFIRSIKMHLIPPGVLELTFAVSEPLCIINDDMVVVPPKSLLPLSWFQEKFYNSLPIIAVDSFVLKSVDVENLIALIKQLPQEICMNFALTLKTVDELLLTDKNEPRFSLVCRVDKMPMNELARYGSIVKSLLSSRGAFASKCINSWLADLRFEKQIVLSKR